MTSLLALARMRKDAPVRKTPFMPRKRISWTAPCPCGSGKKYKPCCSGRGFEYVEDEQGGVFRSTPLTGELKAVLEGQRRRFVEKHGREPGPNDRVFFDLPPVEHVAHAMVEGMKEAGPDPALIKDLDEWDAAIREYEEKHGRAKPRKAKGRQKGQPRFPIGTVASYGPADRTPTKIAAAVIRQEGAEPVLKRWVGSDVTTSPKVQRELQAFFEQHGVRSVAMSEGNVGCPHEEGEDFPAGQGCPFCPFWKGKQGSNRHD